MSKANRSKNHNKRTKGVTRSGNKWRADYNQKYIGTYKSEILAALAYDEYVRGLFGVNAICNIPINENGYVITEENKHLLTGE